MNKGKLITNLNDWFDKLFLEFPNTIINKIRGSKSDAEARRILKETWLSQNKLRKEQLIRRIVQEFNIPPYNIIEESKEQLDDKAIIEQLRREKEVLLERLERINSTIAISNAFGVSLEEVLESTLNQNVQLKEDNKTLNEELEGVINDRDDLAKKFIEFKDRENVILEASIKEVENRKKVLINKILDFNNQYKSSISTIQDFKNGVHRACTQIIDLVEKM